MLDHPVYVFMCAGWVTICDLFLIVGVDTCISFVAPFLMFRGKAEPEDISTDNKHYAFCLLSVLSGICHFLMKLQNYFCKIHSHPLKLLSPNLKLCSWSCLSNSLWCVCRWVVFISQAAHCCLDHLMFPASNCFFFTYLKLSTALSFFFVSWLTLYKEIYVACTWNRIFNINRMFCPNSRVMMI